MMFTHNHNQFTCEDCAKILERGRLFNQFNKENLEKDIERLQEELGAAQKLNFVLLKLFKGIFGFDLELK